MSRTTSECVLFLKCINVHAWTNVSILYLQISLPFITAGPDGPEHIDANLTRTEFEKIAVDLLDRCRTPVEHALRDANLKMNDIQEVILVGGSTRIPAVQQIVQQFAATSPNMTVNPDEVVALGAAVQAGVLSGDVPNIVLLDVTPLSLGVETLGGITTKLIPRNTTVPTSKSEIFSTAADGQTSVEINVLQGEREFVRDNKSLGNFRLDAIPPAPRGMPKIEIRFDIDANGILSVTATEKESGKKADIKITGASTLAKEDVERMVEEANKFAEEDKNKREAIDTKNQADSMVYQTRKQLSEYSIKLPNDICIQVNNRVNELEEAMKNEDVTNMKGLMKDLQQDVMRMTQVMYNKQVDAPGSKQVTSDNKAVQKTTNDKVTDADFADKK